MRILSIILLSLMVFAPSTQAQVDELSILGSLTSGANLASDESDQPESQAVDKPQNEISQKRDYTNQEYGFTGGRNFNAPPKSKFTDKPLTHFGYNYFTDQPGLYAPLNNAPVPPDYLIGPDDNVKIILFGNNNKKYSLTVTRDGDIFIPDIGPLTVAGITFEDLKSLVSQTVSNQLIGTEVNVTLGSLRSIDIFVLGAANKPGLYNISALSTLTNAIIQSGGIDLSGSLRDIKLKRNGKVVASFDFYDLLLNGDTSNDARLMQGDVVFIESIGKTAAIQGEVNRSGIFELKDNEDLSDLLRFAGNTKPKANLKTSDLTRINSTDNSFELISLDLSMEDTQKSALKNGDVVSIYPLADNLRNAILVSGHAQQPGFYSLTEGMKLLDLFKGPEDILKNTDLNYVLIKRQDNASQSLEFHQIDFEQLFSESEPKMNILLADQDEIIFMPSLLTPEQITTKMIQDQYVLDPDSNQMIPKDNWTSLTYLRKSLMEESIKINQENRESVNFESEEDSMMGNGVYYEYSIYDYCTIPENLAIMVLEDSGFRVEKSIPIEELEKLATPEDFILLQQRLERERIELLQDEDKEALSTTITSLCREQLLEPLIDEIERNDNDEMLDIVSVYGNVHFPGIYPYTKNMVLSDAIKAGGGSRNGTYDAEIELTSIDNAGKTITTKNNSASYDQVNDIILQEMDTINLKQISTNLKTVEITGEVYFPGTYPISEEQTLGELIKRAGGITEFGSTKASYFQRESLKEAETSRLKSARNELKRKILLSSQSDGLGQASLDSAAINQLTALIAGDTEESEALGRLVINLQGILNGSIGDIILEDGDTINIPKRKQSVSVIGEVFVSNSHIFREKLSIEDYISLSGGATSFADQDNIYLIKSDGSILSPNQFRQRSGFFRENNSSLEPGDTIVVPLQVQPFSGIKATTEITQIIYQMALAAAAVNSF